MIKLKDILLESTTPDIFIPRRIENRLERMIRLYIKNGSKGTLNLQHSNLTVLPEMLKDITVDGSFYCGHNKLTSLDGATEYVGGNFGCISNNLTSLTGAPKSVGRDFGCSYNNLTSLTGAPKSVGRNFFCGNNNVQFTREQVRAVCDVKGKIFV